MSINRRSTLKGMIGGILAAPSVAENIENDIKNYGEVEANPGLEYVKDISIDSMYIGNLKSKLISERDELLRLLDGELPFYLKNNKYFGGDRIDQLNVLNLKSVSETGKAAIIENRHRERTLKSHIERAKQRLPEILKQIAGL